mmetsp:Transcript_13989/g.33045  ORF Transcript_13989/g.33045 Transcript_13989/m.33045 type:complete len:302 (-) Transcript_13989:1622-2527(-)
MSSCGPSQTNTHTQHLKEDVEHVGVCFLDLVEEDDGEGLSPDSFCQLAALAVADVSGRRAHKFAHAVALHVLAHVEPDHRALVAKIDLGEGFRDFGLTNTRRAGEQESTNGASRIFEPRAVPAHRPRDRVDRIVLPHNTGVEVLAQVLQLLCLCLVHPLDGHTGPGRHDRGDLVSSHLRQGHVLVVLLERFLQLSLPLEQKCSFLIEALCDRVRFRLDDLFQLIRLLHDGIPLSARGVVERLPLHVGLNTDAAASFIDQIDGLVGHIPIRDVSVRKLDGRIQRLVGVKAPMVLLVRVFQGL